MQLFAKCSPQPLIFLKTLLKIMRSAPAMYADLVTQKEGPISLVLSSVFFSSLINIIEIRSLIRSHFVDQ